jgi:hypothetical protein
MAWHRQRFSSNARRAIVVILAQAGSHFQAVNVNLINLDSGSPPLARVQNDEAGAKADDSVCDVHEETSVCQSLGSA